MTVTTIKVTSETRDLLKRQAAAGNVSLGEHVARLALAADRGLRFEAMRAVDRCDGAGGSARLRARDAGVGRRGPELMGDELASGAVLWAWLDPSVGREQSRRPVVVVSGAGYLDVVTTLTIVVPVTTVDRGWPHHVPLTGVSLRGFAMTEQPRTISRTRLGDRIGSIDDRCLAEIRMWLGDFLEL